DLRIHLEGLHLSLELAAARIRLLPPRALLSRLKSRLALLTTGRRDAPMRQQTLRHTLRWSYELLSADEQRLFRLLSIFAGGFTLESVETIAGLLLGEGIPILEGVASLLDKSLIQAGSEDEEQARLFMLETVREFGLECLQECAAVAQTELAHTLYYLKL